jgi:hypothetical protein
MTSRDSPTPCYMIAGIIGAVAAMSGVNKFWYPAPDIHGAPLGLLAAFILMGGFAVGVAILWLVVLGERHSRS